MSTESTLLRFLRLLDLEFPLPRGEHHGLVRTRYGSKSAGWEEKLTLILRQKKGVVNFFLDSGDLDHPKVTLRNIRELLKDSEK